MTRKIVFDTLRYAKMLEKAQVNHPDAHALALADAIVQNIYTKDEVDKMIDATFKQFEARTQEIAKSTEALKQSIAGEFSYHKHEMLKLENRFEKAINRNLYATISILGGLIVTVGVISTFAHSFLH